MSPNINPEHVITLQGQQYCTYRGVLECAHNLGLESIRTRLLQVSSAENEYVAIVEAEVRLKDGRVFTDVADASPKNVHPRLATALIRMASTRAKGRALRDAVNIGEALAEELPDIEPEPPAAARPGAAPRIASRPPEALIRPSPVPEDSAADELPEPPLEPAPAARPSPAAEMAFVPGPAAASVPADAPAPEPVCSDPECGRPVTRGQYLFSMQRWGRPLCPACQRKQPGREKAPA